MKRLQLTRDTVGTVARGHPWVYREGVRGSAGVGEPVLLVDAAGRAVAFGLFDEGPIAVRVLGREAQEVAGLVRRRLDAAWERRRLVGGDTDCFRACNGEGDALPGVVIDRYADVAVLKLYAKAWERHLGAIVDAVATRVRTVYRRFGVARVDDREGGETLAGEEPPDGVVVREHGMRMLARVRSGQKTGLFLDQREHRRLVRGWSGGRSVANLFSYNGGFSLAAALGGATRVVSVDVAPAAIEDAKENFRLNGIDPARHGFEVADAFQWSGKADLVVCDPPSLAHTREQEGAARKAYRDLHKRIAGAPLIATSSCTARLSHERWEEAVREGLGGGYAWLWRSAEPVDHPVGIAHPEGRYLKFALVARV
ncbi:MAG: class I SAM-dependent rRNA methyltransferase [Myxococcota bacterium]